MNFKQNLKRLRKTGGFTQLEVAKKINVSVQTIKNWENEDKSNYPDINYLYLMANLFAVEPTRFFVSNTPRSTNILQEPFERYISIPSKNEGSICDRVDILEAKFIEMSKQIEKLLRIVSEQKE